MSDYEDDFEDYAEDFEAEPSPEKVAPAKPMASATAAPTKPAKQAKNPQIATAPPVATSSESSAPEKSEGVIPEYSSKKSDRKSSKSTPELSETPVQTAGTTKSAPKKSTKFAPMDLSMISLSESDPRAKRLAKLHASRVLEMQEVKHTMLNLAPSTRLDLYYRMLRAAHPPIKQIGVPDREEVMRDAETTTDDIKMTDKAVQFSYGDDTDLLAAIELVRMRKLGKVLSPDRISRAGTSSAKEISASAGSSNRLTLFTQRASLLCEKLLNERGNSSTRSRKPVSEASIFSKDDPGWVQLGKGGVSGANEFIRTRSCLSLRFNPSHPNMLITVHPYDDKYDEDLKPYKGTLFTYQQTIPVKLSTLCISGLLCIWDVNAASVPTWVLECAGNPTVGAFSATQSYIIVAGTSEGVV